MTQNIALEITGGSWYNAETFIKQLAEFDKQVPVFVDLRSEGPSLTWHGITDVIDQWLIQQQRHPSSVFLTRWSNPVEWVPYQKLMCNSVSHFFPMSVDYWLSDPVYVRSCAAGQKLFAFFVGRLDIARSVILYEIGTQFKSHALISLMTSKNVKPWESEEKNFVDKDRLEQWLERFQQTRMIRWFDNTTVDSIDGLNVRDQYTTPTSYADTNKSLVRFYDQFAIEIVAETYCEGTTFFPTEKTVRPLMALKPMIVFGPKYYLSRLRAMGFQTWHELWDESYDLLEGAQRWQMMKKTMAEIIAADAYKQKRLWRDAETVCRHNRKVLIEVIKQSRIMEPWMTANDPT